MFFAMIPFLLYLNQVPDVSELFVNDFTCTWQTEPHYWAGVMATERKKTLRANNNIIWTYTIQTSIWLS